MKKLFKILVPIVLLILIVNSNQIKNYFNFEEAKEEIDVVLTENPKPGTKQSLNEPMEKVNTNFITEEVEKDFLVNDSLYRWDEKRLDWVTVDPTKKILNQKPAPIFSSSVSIKNGGKATEINWELLQYIQYQLKYFKKIEMETFAPVFSEAVKALDGKEVIIKGFVIPIDIDGELLALSANSYSACFFCGNASPASVMSMYLKKKKTFKIDAFKKFHGVLKLNYDNPEEFYYILQEVTPIN